MMTAYYICQKKIVSHSPIDTVANGYNIIQKDDNKKRKQGNDNIMEKGGMP